MTVAEPKIATENIPTKNRIDETFARFNTEKRSALICYTMAGDPDYKNSLQIMKTLAAAGADIIELGMPFSDPMADGPTIQEAAIRSLANGTTLPKVLEQLYEFRQTNDKTPIVLMGYINPILKYGIAEFCNDAKLAGADGLIIVDLPPEEEPQFATECAKNSLHIIRLVAPTTPDRRIEYISRNASGFIYYVSLTGVTGTKLVNPSTVLPSVKNIRKHTSLPIAVGFGVKTPEQAEEIGKFADAVVVGSAIVSDIGANLKKAPLPRVQDKIVMDIYATVTNISRALRQTNRLY